MKRRIIAVVLAFLFLAVILPSLRPAPGSDPVKVKLALTFIFGVLPAALIWIGVERSKILEAIGWLLLFLLGLLFFAFAAS